MSQLKVLVVGASIAGPTTAYWLARAGAHVTVIERFPQLRTAGQAIDIRSTGVTIMRKMPGMEPAVRAKNTSIAGMSFVRDDGTPYGTITSTGNPEQQSLISEYEIFRGDLGRIIYDLTKDNDSIKYIFNEQIASMQQSEKEDGPITVEFTNVTPTTTYDLVVACDGSHSRTRAMGLNCGVRDHIDPSNCWSCFFSIKEDILNGGLIGKAVSAPGGRAVMVGPDPSGLTRITLMSLNAAEKRDLTLEFREAMGQGEEALKRYITKKFRGAGWKTDEILDAMMGSTDFYANEVVVVRTPSVHKGRFVMVGDAGYAPSFTGTGTTLALTGAYVLAGEVARHKGDLEAGLKGYEERMRPIIDDMQKVPPFVTTIMAPQTAWGIWLRNNIFAFIAWTNVMANAQRFFGGAAQEKDKYGLPDYEWVV